MFKRLLIGLALVAAVGVGAVVGQSGPGITGTNSENQNSILSAGMLAVTRDDGITAFAGGGQASARQLVYGLNRVSTVATAADSVKLPSCVTVGTVSAGKIVIVINADAADSMNVFGQTGETINALSPNAAFAVAANKTVIFVCASDGKWYSLTTASLGDGFGRMLAANDNREAARHAA